MSEDKRLIDVTVGEFADYLAEAIINKVKADQKPNNRQLVKGIKGIMQVLQKSKSYVTERHALGLYEKACISGTGRGKLYDSELLLKLDSNKK